MATDPIAEDDPQVRPLAAALQEIDRGRLHRQGSNQLHELIAACLRFGKDGDITIKVHIHVANVDEARLEVSGTVTTKLPQPSAKTSIFFVDENGNLTRQDPSQLEFDVNPVRVVPTANLERLGK